MNFLPKKAPIRQGDIFIHVPRIDIPRLNLPLAVTDADGNDSLRSWTEIAQDGKPVIVSVAVRPVKAIVATQDCDAVRAPEIVLCEILPFEEVEGKAKSASKPKALVNLITQHARINQKWFYLPQDKEIGFDLRMAVDFRITLRVLREDLEQLKTLRAGRLNRLAEDHFRERLGEFWRRYAYDEWYSLSPSEFEEYRKDREGVEPFPWQKS